MKDIVERDPQVVAVARILKTVRPDVLLINELDHDFENAALKAFLDLLVEDEPGYPALRYPYFFAPPQNVGAPSGLDLDGDGKLGGPGDAYGFGHFRGRYAMALLSRFPIADGAVDLAEFRWRDLPGADLPTQTDGAPFPSEDAQAAMRLSSKGHWAVPIAAPGGTFWALAAHPTPPVFDGPEDANGKRNGDEVRLLIEMIEGRAPGTTGLADAPFVVLGDLNADPNDGDGKRAIIRSLLNRPRVQDPKASSEGARVAAVTQAGANVKHRGDPALDTADWRDDRGPGNLRVDFVLPSVEFAVTGAGVFWPAPGQAGAALLGRGGNRTSDHHLVWVDLE